MILELKNFATNFELRVRRQKVYFNEIMANGKPLHNFICENLNKFLKANLMQFTKLQSKRGL